jgi:uncharacterized protein
MSISSYVKLALLSATLLQAEPKVFGPSQIQEIYRVTLERDDLLLESIEKVIKEKKITDGQVLITAGSVQECRYHYVTTVDQKPKDEYRTIKGPYEILSSGGIIADGQPHIHISLGNQSKEALGGHLEPGCKILYLGEVTIVKYSGGPALTRKPNANGVGIMQAK